MFDAQANLAVGKAREARMPFKALAIAEPDAAGHGEVWSLFVGREALDRDMTSTVNQLLGLHAPSTAPFG